MTKNPYSVRLDESRNRPWVLDLKASHFGARKRIFFETEVEAFAEGGRLVELLREKGREGLRAESGGITMAQATRLWNLGADDCRHVLDTLVDAGFLRWTARRTVVRATSSSAEMRQAAPSASGHANAPCSTPRAWTFCRSCPSSKTT